VAGKTRNLHLEEGIPRKKSDVEMYMILYYDTRIRETVIKAWAEDRVPALESRVEDTIPDDEIEPYESFLFKDSKIPISYKKGIAQKLFDAESDAFKAGVRVQKEAWQLGKSVRTGDEEERVELVRQYQKYVPASTGSRRAAANRFHRSDITFRNVPGLSRNVKTVLRNAERRCSAKGIMWLACPSPAKGGKPVGFL
jgi:hypothetical protein